MKLKDFKNGDYTVKQQISPVGLQFPMVVGNSYFIKKRHNELEVFYNGVLMDIVTQKPSQDLILKNIIPIAKALTREEIPNILDAIKEDEPKYPELIVIRDLSYIMEDSKSKEIRAVYADLIVNLVDKFRFKG